MLLIRDTMSSSAEKADSGPDAEGMSKRQASSTSSWEDIGIEEGAMAAISSEMRAQQLARAAIASMLVGKADDAAETPAFELAPGLPPLSRQRVLFEGKIWKRGTKSRTSLLLGRSNQRYGILLTHCLLITVQKKDKLIVHQQLPLQFLTLQKAHSLKRKEFPFCISAPERDYVLYLQEEKVRSAWVEKIHDAICSVLALMNPVRTTVPGWRHRILRGSIYSMALLAKDEGVESLLILLEGGENQEPTLKYDDMPDADGCTPLHYAAHSGSQLAVDLLLNHGAEANALDNNLDTPLHFAARKAAHDVAESLLSRGSDPNLTNMANKTALHYAIDPLPGVSAEKAALFIRTVGNWGGDVNAMDIEGRPLLFQATAMLSVEAVRALLAVGADANRFSDGARVASKASKSAFTALHLIAEESAKVTSDDQWKNCLDIIEALLRSGAAANARDGSGRTPLHCSAAAKSKDVNFRTLVCLKLVQGGARIWEEDGSGESALDAAERCIPGISDKLKDASEGWARSVEPNAQLPPDMVPVAAGKTSASWQKDDDCPTCEGAQLIYVYDATAPLPLRDFAALLIKKF